MLCVDLIDTFTNTAWFLFYSDVVVGFFYIIFFCIIPMLCKRRIIRALKESCCQPDISIRKIKENLRESVRFCRIDEFDWVYTVDLDILDGIKDDEYEKDASLKEKPPWRKNDTDGVKMVVNLLDGLLTGRYSISLKLQAEDGRLWSVFKNPSFCCLIKSSSEKRHLKNYFRLFWMTFLFLPVLIWEFFERRK